MCRVSIIIPCFNDGKYLPEAVESASAQTYPNIEIIVVDDHSTDPKTQKRLQKMVESGLCVLQTPTGKKGPSAARNVGIAAATGEYILPLDADDLIEPTYAEKAVAVLEANPDVGICYCRAGLFGLKRGPWRLPAYSPDLMLLENMIFATAFFRRSAWEAVGGYDESLTLGHEDHAFWLALLERGAKVFMLEDILFYYRIKANSRTAQMAQEDRAEKAKLMLVQAQRQVYERNVDKIVLAWFKLRNDQERLNKSYLYRLLKPAFSCEWALRQWIKRRLGRA